MSEKPLSMDEMIASLRGHFPGKTDDDIRAEIERAIAQLRDAPIWWDEGELIKASEAIAND